MGKLKKLVVLGALGAIVTAVAKRLQGGNESPWQSAPEPTSPTTPPVPPTPPTPPAPTEAPDELLVDNAPAPIDEPEQVPPPPAPADARPDPLTDPLPEEPRD
ncbi:hypothetical protein ACFFOS_16395 [Nocardioides kongjuensis]|uniref:Uncharacterized protein n=1 Tax=Nocardioides kongjuensis TaxID=349522 RepID=A0A852RN54_9ACTN|nr:hypothetical protein [Nocardioides kongjuensis]NYD32435.1 hypothetical protein [Nocardioides kongjuensis]